MSCQKDMFNTEKSNGFFIAFGIAAFENTLG